MSDGKQLVLSPLGHTWILDLDGSVVVHNGYKDFGRDVFLDGAKDFLLSIPENDMIIFLTSRKHEYREITEAFLVEEGIRYNHIIYDAPYGERILLNDDKPSGLSMGKAINSKRDVWCDCEIVIDENI